MPENNRDSFLAQFRDPERLTLTRRTFIKMYGYELSYPGTAAEAIALLKEAGCSRAEEYYNATVAEQEQKQNEMYKSVAVWLKARKSEGVNKWKKQQEAEQQRTNRETSREYVTSQILKWWTSRKIKICRCNRGKTV